MSKENPELESLFGIGITRVTRKVV